ncbi:MAG TPA: HAD-IIIC family phosphatase [Verrucomicrobiae bacterium]|nr:HAD-IIIC family phosphatase [Verrucomicrobiae bacterium]
MRNGIFNLPAKNLDIRQLSMDPAELKKRLLSSDPAFWDLLRNLTGDAGDFEEIFLLSSLRKKAHARGVPRTGPAQKKLRLGIVGGYSLYPLHELIEHLCEVQGFPCEVWLGAFDNYMAEITDPGSGLYEFAPEVVLLLPAESRCAYTGNLTDSRQMQQEAAGQAVDSLLKLTAELHQRSGAEVIVTNFLLPARHDLGSFRGRTLGSDWAFRKWVNLELGLNAPAYLHVCDLEFLSHRLGAIHARDDRAWFESKQPCSPALQVELAREVAQLIGSFRRPPKKVLALDLDNTLWGGVVADDGLEGIELGDTSPRGEAFKAFQKYVKSLKQRGVLLAVCSKNDPAKAEEVFRKHPEMVLGLDDLVSFQANWEPKSDNLRVMASQLNLGLDSFVFVDDNPAEIEIVRQFTPEVATILLGPDPSTYVAQLQDCRHFEPRSITTEDAARTGQYRSEVQRKELEGKAADMDSYLESLEMQASINEFVPEDVPRLAQLINKSNQFNLTTRRRTEADVLAVMNDPDCIGFSVRLKDRFGDHGLISIVIGQRAGHTMKIDTWLMSCRVLKRQVEEMVLNELARISGLRGCNRLEGLYLPTPKNDMVRDFYARMGFALMKEDAARREFELKLDAFHPIGTKIKIVRRAYDSN